MPAGRARTLAPSRHFRTCSSVFAVAGGSPIGRGDPAADPNGAPQEMSGIVGATVVLALAGLLGWGSYRLWHVRSTPLRLVGGLTSTLLTLIVASAAAVGLLGLARLYLPDGAPAPPIPATASPAGLQLAARRVNGCTGCHSTAMAQPLDGGATNMLADGPALG